MSGSQSKNWVFTLNNPTDSEQDDPKTWPHKYLVFQAEIGESGTPHLQGYIIFPTNKRLAAVKKINGKAHWEVRAGNHQQAKAYNTKEETRYAGPWFFGEEPVGQGHRTDLDKLHEKLKEPGMTYRKACDETFIEWCQHRSAIREFILIHTPPRNFKTETTIVWGPAGVGKSTFVKNLYPTAYWKDQTCYWDGYDNDEIVVIDEFSGFIPLSQLNTLMDEHPAKVAPKYGSSEFVTKKLFILTNIPPNEWFKPEVYKHDRYNSLFRRIDHFLIKEDFNPPREISRDDAKILWPQLISPPGSFNSRF